MRALSFVSDGQAAVAEEPSDRPLDLPAVPTEAFAGLDAWPRDARDERTLSSIKSRGTAFYASTDAADLAACSIFAQ